jgi:hypothetical protein
MERNEKSTGDQKRFLLPSQWQKWYVLAFMTNYGYLKKKSIASLGILRGFLILHRKTGLF